jgi:hypothetical protein
VNARRLAVAALLAAGLQTQVARAEWSLWPWGKSENPIARHTEPSAWDKMSTGTKNIWSKTKEAVTPGQQSPHRTASMTSRKAPSQRNKKAKKSWMSSWFGPEEKQGPQTVNEFLKQPRPDF